MNETLREKIAEKVVRGKPFKTGYHGTLAERFWNKVYKTTNCWFWLGSRTHNGYGRFYVDGKNKPAQVVAWEIANGRTFPEGKLGTHTCDIPSCVRPDHIIPATSLQNIQDAIARGCYSAVRRRFQTKCYRGHSLDSVNTYVRPEGTRECRICNKLRRICNDN